jgi:hypothetical protein
MTIGHEIVGIVHSIREDVDLVKSGDLPGIEDLDGFEQFNGGQAGFVRIPLATENLLLLPPGKNQELDAGC